MSKRIVQSVMNRIVHHRDREASHALAAKTAIWKRVSCAPRTYAVSDAMASPLPTLLFCTAYIAEESWWLGRYKPWVDYYQPLPLRRDATFMLDDLSPYIPEDQRLVVLDDLPSKVDPQRINLYRFAEHIGNDRRNRHRGWWRSFLFSLQIARQYGLRKIIHVESDAYLISQRVVDYLTNLDSGWTALWCPTYQMPEAQILHPDPGLPIPQKANDLLFRVALLHGSDPFLAKSDSTS